MEDSMDKKTIRLIGYFLMMIGISLPLYSFTHLSINKYSEKAHYVEFKKNQDEVLAEDAKKISQEAEEYNHQLQDDVKIIDPFDSVDYKKDYDFSTIDPEAVFAYISIPALDLYQPIRLDATDRHLAIGVAHVDGTSLPIGGIGTRSVIAGHRGGFDNVMFLNIGELTAGDDVYIDVLDQTLHYKVTDSEFIKPNEWEKLAPDKKKDRLTLLTCDPVIPPVTSRLLVNCDRVIDDKLEDSTHSDDTEEVIVPVEHKKVKNRTHLIYVITAFLWVMMGCKVSALVRFILQNK